MIVLVLVSIVLLCAYMKFRWSRRRMYELARAVPDVAPALPLIGHAHYFIGNSTSVFQTILEFAKRTNQLQSVSKVWVGPELYYVLYDPEDVTTALNVCIEKNFAFKFFQSWLGDGLITSNECVWKYRHRKLLPAFNQKILNSFVPIFNKESSLMVETMAKENKTDWFDPDPYVGGMTLETICQTTMGVSTEQTIINNSSYLKAAHTVLGLLGERVLKFWLYPDLIYRLFGYQKIRDDAIKILKNVSNTVINKKKAEFEDKSHFTRQETNEVRERPFRAFLELLLELNKDDVAFTDEAIREEVDTMIAAGQETTAYAIQYALLLLGSNQNKQDKVFSEIKDVFGTSDRCVDREDLPKLVYLEAVINETLRLFPIVMVIVRLVVQEIKLKSCTLPVGSSIIVGPWHLHRHERWGDDYDSFRPERFFEPDCPSKVPGAFCPFAAGKRMCIGKTYAMMSIKTVLVQILRKYKVFSEIHRLKLRFDIALRPLEGNLIKLEKR